MKYLNKMYKVEFLQDWSYGALTFRKNEVYDMKSEIYEIAKMVVPIKLLMEQPFTKNRMITAIDYRTKPIDTKENK
jgi:hypothetical protein